MMRMFFAAPSGVVAWCLAVSALSAVAAGLWLVARRSRRALRRERVNRETALAELDRENDRLRKENNRLNYDMIVLYQFVTNLASCRSTDAVYQEFVATVRQSINPDVCGLFLCGTEDGRLRLAAHHGLREFSGAMPDLSDGKGLIGWVAAQGREAVVKDARQDPRFPELTEPPFAPHFRSAIGLPLLFQNKPLGVVVIGRAEGSFTQDELRLLFIVTNEGALYLQNLRLYEEKAMMAIVDGSTGLYNHRHFFDQIDLQLAAAREYDFRLSLLMIDVDNFKHFNDEHGHLTGDAILREVARLIEDCVESDHLVARYGGEEFAVLMPDTDTVKAFGIAEKIRRRVDEHKFVTLDRREAHVQVSIGLATYPDHLEGTAKTVTDLIAAADEQLVARAKTQGRNKVCGPDRPLV